MKFRNPFAAKTAKSIVSAIFDQIDQLEKVSEQQEMIRDHIRAQIDDLAAQKKASEVEGRYAEDVAARLRAIVVSSAEEA